MTKISSTLPKEVDRNAMLSVEALRFLEDPDTLRPALVLLKTHKIVTDTETGESEATVRIERIELIPPNLLPDGEDLMRAAIAKRLKMDTLPIDIQDDVAAAFSDLKGTIRDMAERGITVEFDLKTAKGFLADPIETVKDDSSTALDEDES